MLAAYETAVQQLIQLVPSGLIPTPAIVSYINTARNQIAGESECIRVYATLSISVAAGQQYPFSAIAFPVGTQGVGPVQSVADITFALGTGRKTVYSREWPWFNRFVLSKVAPVPAQPRYWAQFGQGTQGTIFVNLPNATYILSLNTVCLPIPLVDDSTPEALPELWTDAVPYFAAYMAFLQLQRQADADRMMELYKTFMQRARAAATPSELPHQFSGTPDPTLGNKLGIQQRRTAA